MGVPVLFVDLDGTVRHGFDELGRFVNVPADVVIFPEAVRQMRAWRAAGGVVIGVTNQAGVALGHVSAGDLGRTTEHTQVTAEHQIDAVFSCQHAPDATCWCRKPQPGMLYTGLEFLAGRGIDVAPRDECLMVGDMDSDRLCAERAGVPFRWADEWRAEAA